MKTLLEAARPGGAVAGEKNADAMSPHNFYVSCIKRGLDILLSLGGLIVLSPLYLLIALAIIVDDPGPIFFTQRRVGKNKSFFNLHKFRSMKQFTPRDVPTHLLDNPEHYITRVGRVLRKYSLDELPQIGDILAGHMSVVGPRPALWNQEDLVDERDKYGVNAIIPGLTGWAQINGRDKLDIPAKAKLDGDYAAAQRKGAFAALLMDIRCFFGTFLRVFRASDVVEGHRYSAREMGFEDYGFKRIFTVDRTARKKVLITGAHSYIGMAFEAWARRHYPANFEIDTLDMHGDTWKNRDFSLYDVVFHVAGIAHADISRVSKETKALYHAVNTDLAIEAAQKARDEGVKQFVFMSSMIVYGASPARGGRITKDTIPCPANFYGNSKWQADKNIRALQTENFRVATLRPPMIYGPASKGNFPLLVRLAKRMIVFPDFDNERSMLYIDNLTEFLCLLMLTGEGGVFFPQNAEYTRTADMVRMIALASGRKLLLTRLLNPAVALAFYLPGKISGLAHKAFGNSAYDQEMSRYEGLDYQKISLERSIQEIEGIAE